MKTGKVRYAVVGQGYFAQKAVLPAFEHVKGAEVSALVSGDAVKLSALGKKYGIRSLFGYDEYDELLRSGLVDAVYIALPNWMHREFAERAARAGVHVLCEKPMALSASDCESMIRTAEDCGVKLMVAYRLHFEEANLSCVEKIRSGKLGDPRIFNSVFSFPVEFKNIRAKPERTGGGPVYDIGIYCINAARYLFQSEPTRVFAVSGRRPKGAIPGIHESVSATLVFPEGRLAHFVCSYAAAPVAWYQVVGTEGDLILEEAYSYHEDMTRFVTLGEKTKEKVFRTRDQIAPEIEYFSECIRKNKVPEPSGREGLIDVRIIQAIHESLDSGVPVELSLPVRKRRPTLKQERRKPPLRKEPSLIRVREPEKAGKPEKKKAA